MRATRLQEKRTQIRLTQRPGTVLTNMAVAALIIAALYFGREIFVPLALAVLLSFVLAPFFIRGRPDRQRACEAKSGSVTRRNSTARPRRTDDPGQNHRTIAFTAYDDRSRRNLCNLYLAAMGGS